MARVTTLRDLVIKADPDYVRERDWVTEYVFSAQKRGGGRAGELTHEGGVRVFRARESKRGAYADD
jgi:hypothetical protein